MRGELPSLRRLPATIQLSVMLAILISAIIGFIPNYDRMIYSHTEPVDYSEAQYYAGYIGYPAGDDVLELVSKEEILKEDYSYTLVVDAENIKPLHLFFGLCKDTMTKSAFTRFMNRDENEKVFGQFFSVELENGDTVILLLDDYAIKLPRKGMIKLPIGETKKLLWTDVKDYLREKHDFSEDELACYVDMGSGWRGSKIAERIVTVRITVMMVMCIVIGFGAYFIIEKIDRKERAIIDERMKRERMEKELEYKRKNEGG